MPSWYPSWVTFLSLIFLPSHKENVAVMPDSLRLSASNNPYSFTTDGHHIISSSSVYHKLCWNKLRMMNNRWQQLWRHIEMSFSKSELWFKNSGGVTLSSRVSNSRRFGETYRPHLNSLRIELLNPWRWRMLRSTTWHDMTWHDMTWHDMTWHECLCLQRRLFHSLSYNSSLTSPKARSSPSAI